jgi:predicted amidohydrolase YtcJ
VLNESPLNEHRYRIEHYVVVSNEDMQRTAEYAVVPSIQGLFPASDSVPIQSIIAQEDMCLLYNWPQLISLGLKLANGSDSPVESVNPFDGIWSSVTLQHHDERTA